jgi:FlaA1/EpsC-like NDP-sugar epimerase
MLVQLKNTRFYLMLVLDAAVFSISLLAAYLLRFEFVLNEFYVQQILTVLPYVILLKLALFYVFRLYKGMWRYSSVEDFWRLGQASLLAMLATTGSLSLIRDTCDLIPRSILLIDGVLTFVMAGGVRVGIRSYYAAMTTSKGLTAFCLPRMGTAQQMDSKRILIVGAGGSGEKIVREIFDNPQLSYEVVGFLDDDRGKQGRAVHGIPVLGPVDRLPEILEKVDIKEILISIPSATGVQMRRIVEICKRCGRPYRTLPAMGEIMDGKVSIKALRDVNYEDLLRRLPVHLDMSGIQDYLSGRTILVTGAGGSIGSELCRQAIRFNPERLILVDACEANLFGIQTELRDNFGFLRYHSVLTAVQHRSLMECVFDTYRPQVVFHAAAYKHVPMLERNPWEAFFNNVLASKVTMELAIEHNAERFVLVSTDKAVRPTNVMGTTKRLAELILQSRQHNGTRLMGVRFGNVVGSSGSVIPLFQNQIRGGGPVTVTHPEMTRYFMTIREAAQLILDAGAIGEGGEIFVLEMGTPVKIADMARDLIRLSGKEPDVDIPIVFTGLRPGEKLFEELITNDEDVVPTRHEKIMVLTTNGYSKWNGHGNSETFLKWLDKGIGELSLVADSLDACAIKRKLKEMVPEYSPQETECVLDMTERSNGGNAI